MVFKNTEYLFEEPPTWAKAISWVYRYVGGTLDIALERWVHVSDELHMFQLRSRRLAGHVLRE
jgi:hypothetical protein